MLDHTTACLVVARHYEDEAGVWAYRAFEEIDERFFGGKLPWPNIRWELTAHGRCLASVRPVERPIIVLHPSILGGTVKTSPWRIDRRLLGWAFAFDILLHECMHLNVRCMKQSENGSSSHNNPGWIAEVNRLAPLVGLPGVDAQMSKLKRFGKTVKRITEGNVPFNAAATFPFGVRAFRKELSWYRKPHHDLIPQAAVSAGKARSRLGG